MYRVTVVDFLRMLPEEIKGLPLWKKAGNFVLTDPVFREQESLSAFSRMGTDLVFLAANGRYADRIPLMREIRSRHGGPRLVLVGKDDSYEYVRKAFLSGAADYLTDPLFGETVERTIRRIRDQAVRERPLCGIRTEAGFVAERLLSEEDADVPCLCRSLAGAVERYAEAFDLNARILLREAEKQVYQELAGRKPWLKEFLPPDSFLNPAGLRTWDSAPMLQQWDRDFRGVWQIIRKYRIVGAPSAVPIGNYILTHVDEKLNLEKISEDIFMNKNYVGNLFKKHVGRSVVDFIKEAKVDRAKVLLLDEKRKIKEVADDLNFSGEEYFRKVFKQKTGLTPTSYRSRVKICGFFGQLL